HFILRVDDDPRGRKPNEVPDLLRAGLLAAGVSEDRVETVLPEEGAVDAALRLGRPGDLVVVFGDNISRCWKQIIYFKDGRRNAEEAATPAPAVPLSMAAEERSPESYRDRGVIEDARGVRRVKERED